MAINIRLGAILGPFASGADSHTIAEKARRFAGEGYDSLWAAQSVGRGFMLTDPFQNLAVAASVTEDVELGTAVLQVPLFHPMELAHRAASLHQICGGRLTLGVGVGSTATDFALYGQDYDNRFRNFNDCMQTLREVFQPGSPAHEALSPWRGVAEAPQMIYGSWGKGVEKERND